MSDILKDLQDKMVDIAAVAGENLPTFKLLARAAAEIARLREDNSDMGWRLNPDRMSGQFTEEEKNRGNEWR